jgi:hypothetical protein
MVDDPLQSNPSSLTTEAIARAITAQRDWTDAQLEVLRERFRGIDRATEVLNEIVTRVPTDVQREVGRLQELSSHQFAALQDLTVARFGAVSQQFVERDARFEAVAQRFAERDARAESEARANKTAIDAAFAAQKELVKQQGDSDQKAIDKAERATAETINKLTQLFATETRALSERLDDVKERLSAVEQQKAGGREANAGMFAVAAFILVLLSIGTVVFALL